MFRYIHAIICHFIYHEITCNHYSDVIMDPMASQITSLAIVYSTIYTGPDEKHQSPVSLAFVWGIHRWPVNSPHKCPVTRKMFPFYYVIMSFKGSPYVWLSISCHISKQCNKFDVSSAYPVFAWDLNTLRPRRMSAFFRTTHSTTISWKKMYEF